jgi:hypothetical protein
MTLRHPLCYHRSFLSSISYTYLLYKLGIYFHQRTVDVENSWLDYIYSLAMLYTDKLPFAINLFSTVLPQNLTQLMYNSFGMIIVKSDFCLFLRISPNCKFNFLQDFPLIIFSIFIVATPVRSLTWPTLNPILNSLWSKPTDSSVNLLSL